MKITVFDKYGDNTYFFNSELFLTTLSKFLSEITILSEAKDIFKCKINTLQRLTKITQEELDKTQNSQKFINLMLDYIESEKLIENLVSLAVMKEWKRIAVFVEKEEFK